MISGLAGIRNEQTIPLDDIPVFDASSFAERLAVFLSKGYRACAYFGDRTDLGSSNLYAVCSDDRDGLLYVISALINEDNKFISLTSRFPQVHLFEREIYEQTGLVPEGHPWLKPVRFLHRKLPSQTAGPQIGAADFYRIDGPEIHQVAVGPVHAGIIEPGHFRFQCHGETVYHLEISLGYQHRGIEEAMRGGPFAVTPFQMEAAAGDTTIGHMSAYCQLVESLSGTRISPRDSLVRAIALELERCANHTGDLGALAGDIGFLPTMSYCGRIRGDYLNLTALICGNRFGRGLVVPGGVGFDLEPSRQSDLSARLQRYRSDFTGATRLLWENSSVLSRFETTGKLSQDEAENLGLVGPPARACGCVRDVRQDHAYGYYRYAHIPVPTYDSGDVFGRAYVRWREVDTSTEFLLQQTVNLENFPSVRQIPEIPDINRSFKADALAVSLVEGWRGEICHVAITGRNGRFKRYKIVDPSFHNWPGLALALRNQQISDFPLCNKSFDLSYCGFDL